MAFNSIYFAIFFSIIFLSFWSLRRHHYVRTILLVLASAWFYTRFDYGPRYPTLGYVYLFVLFASATIDFVLARLMHSIDSRVLYANQSDAFRQRRRKQLMIVSVIYNLGVLVWFKYTGFAIDTVRDICISFGVQMAPRTLQVILPIGISFFTFETMSYTIDVYRRELVPAKSFLEYLLF